MDPKLFHMLPPEPPRHLRTFFEPLAGTPWRVETAGVMHDASMDSMRERWKPVERFATPLYEPPKTFVPIPLYEPPKTSYQIRSYEPPNAFDLTGSCEPKNIFKLKNPWDPGY